MSKLFVTLFVVAAAIFILGAVMALDVFTQGGDIGVVKHKIVVGNTEVFVDIARTLLQRAQGLSGRDMMPANEGLLFVFEKNDRHAIWMKDMRFPIDIVWIDELFSVVDIAENILPSSFPKIFEPKNPARYVLETNAGWVAQNSIHSDLIVEGLRHLF